VSFRKKDAHDQSFESVTLRTIGTGNLKGPARDRRSIVRGGKRFHGIKNNVLGSDGALMCETRKG